MGGGVLGFSDGGAEASYRLRGRRRPSGASTRMDGLPGATELFAARRKTTTSSRDLFGEAVPGWLADIGPGWMALAR
jgi:hypothetical protein